MLVNPARGSDPVDQLALNLDSQALDSICQLDLSHLGNLSAGVGTENVVFQIAFQAIEAVQRNSDEYGQTLQKPTIDVSSDEDKSEDSIADKNSMTEINE